MNLRTFIERPVLSAVISITIVVVGIIGLFSLPVEQYPDIAPPTIMVSTTYYGASAETLQKSVIAPLEEAINGVEDMTYMTSSATNAGTVSITVYFKQGTDPDMAAVNVQNRVSRATGQLPAEVTQVGVTTSKRQTSILQMFSLSSPDDSYDENFLSNYISINLKPEILRISGVGDLMIMGGEYSMRVWMKPDVMAQYKLIPSDITGVLAEQNIESATGSFGENSNETYQYTMKYKGRLITPEEFGDIVIRSTDNGEVLKLKDIAEIQLGQDSYAYHGGMDGHPGVSCMVFQTAGSNATEVNQNIDKFLEEGFNYLDTAHGYLNGKSELAIKECLAKRHKREEYILTDKLTMSYFKKKEDIRPFFESQLKACGVDYFDFYLMHSQSKEIFEYFKKCRAKSTVRDSALCFYNYSILLQKNLWRIKHA